MSKLLFDEQPIVIDRSLAKVLGLNEAIVIQQIHYWIKINEQKKTNFHDNRYWTYNSLKQWHEDNFDFWSFDTVKRTFARLEKQGVLLVGNYNPDPRDRTKWYAINYEVLQSIVEEHKCKGAKCTNGDKSTKGQNAHMQNEPMDKGKMNQPLPENSTENNNTRLIDCTREESSSSSELKEMSTEPNHEIWKALQEHGKSAMILDNVSLAETNYLLEIYTMLENHFSSQLDPEVIRIACELFSERSYDWKELRMKFLIENPVGFFRNCYLDAIKQWKLTRNKISSP